MQNRLGLLVVGVMPTYMIMPRYSHNYAQFYRLLDSNLFTHCNTYAILREATSETYGPGVYFPSYKSPDNKLFLAPFILLSLLILFRILSRSIYPISYKTIYIFTVEGLTTPLTCRVASICSLCADTVYIVLLGSPTGLIAWFHN